MLNPLSSQFYSPQDPGHGMMSSTFKGWVFPSPFSLPGNSPRGTQRCIFCVIAKLAKLMVKINHHTNITGDQVSGALWLGSVIHWPTKAAVFLHRKQWLCESWWEQPWFCGLWDGHILRGVLSRTCHPSLGLCQSETISKDTQGSSLHYLPQVLYNTDLCLL